MIEIPERFRPKINIAYPANNTPPFEEWLSCQDFPETEREWLPVHWTSYYVNHAFGKDEVAMADLQSFIDGLDKSKKYATCVQYDDGILNDISGLDIKVFAMSGSRIDYPLPLICQPHPYEFNVEKDIFCSFLGRITHPIRQQMVDALPKDGRYYINTTGSFGIKEYCEILARSKYVLCPRGYGQSSFRIAEAMQYKAIPVYISDQFVLPYNYDFNMYGVVITEENIPHIDYHLKIVENQPRNIRLIYESLFSFVGAKSLIINNL